MKAVTDQKRDERPAKRVDARENHELRDLVKRRLAQHHLVVVVTAGHLGNHNDQRNCRDRGKTERTPGNGACDPKPADRGDEIGKR